MEQGEDSRGAVVTAGRAWSCDPRMVAQKLVKLRHPGIACITAGRRLLTFPAFKLLLALHEGARLLLEVGLHEGMGVQEVAKLLVVI